MWRVSILDAKIARLDGTPTTLGEITDGRPALLVNVASRCGLTSTAFGLSLATAFASSRLRSRL